MPDDGRKTFVVLGELRLVRRSSLVFGQPVPAEVEMWYTVLKDEVPMGFVELASGALVAAPMLRLPGYAAIASTTQLATHAFLQLGPFGGALAPVPPFPRSLLRLRRSLTRAARLQLVLVDARGAVADTTFVNLLQSADESSVVLIAGFSRASAQVGAVAPPGRLDDSAAAMD